MKSIAVVLALVPLAMHFSSCKYGKKSGALGTNDKDIGPQFEVKKTEAMKLREENISDFINSKILPLKTELALPSYSFELTAGLSLGLQYKYGVDKVQDPKTGALKGVRFDTMVFKQDVAPSLFSGLGINIPIPLPFNFQREQSITYARLFDNTAQAATASPLDAVKMLKLPLSAEAALNMAVGDVVTYPLSAKLVIQAPDFLTQALSTLPGTVRPGVILGGSHKVTVTRLTQKSVRVGIITDSLATASIDAEAGVPGHFAFSKHLSRIVALDAKLFQGKKLDAEFEVDLSNKEAQDAYERALSGKVRFTNAVVLGGSEKLAEYPMLEVQALENMANNVSSQNEPSVLRNRTQFMSFQGTSSRASVNLPFLSWGLEKMHTHNNVIIQVGSAAKQNLKLSMQKISGNRKLFGSSNDGNDWASGLFISANSSTPPQAPAYWQIWRRNYSSDSQNKTQSTLVLLKNLLGPLVFGKENTDSSEFYRGESRVYFPSQLMQVLMNPKYANAIHFWTAAENMVRNFDNKFGLPFNAMPPGALPNYGSAEANAKAESVCTLIRTSWGPQYCRNFGHELIPELLTLQNGATYEHWVAVFEKYGKANFGVNYMGSILVARYLSEFFKVASEVAKLQGTPQEVPLDQVAFNANFRTFKELDNTLLERKNVMLIAQGDFAESFLLFELLSLHL